MTSRRRSPKPVKPSIALGLTRPDASAPVAPVSPTPAAHYPHVVVLSEHVANADAVAAQIEGSPSFEADFGKCAPPADIAEALRIARLWSIEDAKTKAWQAYVSGERDRAWSRVLTALAPLAQSVEGIAARDPTIAERYTALFAFLGAYRERTARAVATKRRKRKDTGAPAQPASPPANGVTNGIAPKATSNGASAA
jgi:hypothetical protein